MGFTKEDKIYFWVNFLNVYVVVKFVVLVGIYEFIIRVGFEVIFTRIRFIGEEICSGPFSFLLLRTQDVNAFPNKFVEEILV